MPLPWHSVRTRIDGIGTHHLWFQIHQSDHEATDSTSSHLLAFTLKCLRYLLFTFKPIVFLCKQFFNAGIMNCFLSQFDSLPSVYFIGKTWDFTVFRVLSRKNFFPLLSYQRMQLGIILTSLQDNQHIAALLGLSSPSSLNQQSEDHNIATDLQLAELLMKTILRNLAAHTVSIQLYDLFHFVLNKLHC